MNEKLNFHDLVGILAEKTGITKKDAENFLREFFDLTTNALLDEKLVKIKNLGTFKIVDVNDRESIDVRTGERVIIPSHSKVSFLPDSSLSKIINEPFAMFEPIEVEGDEKNEENEENERNERNEEDSVVEDDKMTAFETIEEKTDDADIVTNEQTPPEVIETSENTSISELEKTSEIVVPEEQNTTSEIQSDTIEKQSDATENIINEPVESTIIPEIKKKKSKKGLFFSIAALLLVILFGASFYLYKTNDYFLEKINFYAAKITHKEEKKDITSQNDDIISINEFETEKDTLSISEDTVVVDEELLVDTTQQIDIVKTEVIVEEKPKVVEEKTAVVKKKPTSTVKPGNRADRYIVVGGVKKRKIADGERLTLIALQEYGCKDFWVYLYEENKSIIKNPENVMAGIAIIIPPASKYGIDKNNPESVNKAKELQKKLK